MGLLRPAPAACLHDPPGSPCLVLSSARFYQSHAPRACVSSITSGPRSSCFRGLEPIRATLLVLRASLEPRLAFLRASMPEEHLYSFSMATPPVFGPASLQRASSGAERRAFHARLSAVPQSTTCPVPSGTTSRLVLRRARAPPRPSCCMPRGLVSHQAVAPTELHPPSMPTTYLSGTTACFRSVLPCSTSKVSPRHHWTPSPPWSLSSPPSAAY